MIIDKGKFYLYRHIRCDKNIPFYIGVGTKPTKNFTSLKTEYSRAFTIHKENSIWNNITKKTKWKVEILLESDDYAFVLQKEEEFIALYGRKNLKTGILSNLTNGGEKQSGRIGIPISAKHKQILSDRMKLNNPNKDGKFHPFQIPGVRDKVIKRMKENNPRHIKDVWSKKIYQYTLNGEFVKCFNSLSEAGLELKGKGSTITTACKRNTAAYGFIWKYQFCGNKIEKYIPNTKHVTIISVSPEGVRTEYYSVLDASKSLNISKSKVFNMLKTGDTYNNMRLFRKDNDYLSQIAQESNGHFIVGIDDAPEIKGTKFKVKLSKDYFKQ